MNIRLTTLLGLAALAISACMPVHAGTIDDLANRKRNDGRRSTNTLRVAANVADTETVTIGSVVFEADTDSTPTITAGRVRVNIVAAQTPTAFTAALTTAINANNTGFTATNPNANQVVIARLQNGVNATACTETLGGTNNAWAASTAYGGAAEPQIPKTVAEVERAALAVEVGVGNVVFPLPFTPIAVKAAVRSTAGAIKAWDGAVTISGGLVTVDNSGSTDFIAGDIVTIVASN